MCIHYVLFIYSSINGYSCCFLAIVNRAANAHGCAYVSSRSCFHLDINPERKLLDHMIILFIIFLRNHHTVFQRSCTIFHSHQQCAKALIFPHPQHLFFSSFFFFLLLIEAILMGVKWHLIGFYLHFSNDKWYWAPFLILVDNLYILFGEVSLQVLCPIFELVICWGVGILYIFWILLPYQIYDLWLFSTVLYAAFSFSWLFTLMHRSS